MRPEFRSLSLRLILSSAAVSLVLLVSAGLLLANLFSAALERNFDARLRAVLDGLLANVEIGAEGSPVLSQQLADTRFSLPLSGWYWQVEPPEGSKLKDLASGSLLDERLKPGPVLLKERDSDGIAGFYMWDSQNTKLRGIEQPFTLPGSNESFSFLVAGNFGELQAEVQAFRHTLFGILAALGVGLLAANLIQVRFGLRPLGRMQEGLSAIREGRSERLDGRFPSELEPVAEELNLLIQSNSEIIDRARTQVGNLAHALKTPLSVLTNEAGLQKGSLAGKVAEQVGIMRDQVNLYLDRARRAARAQGLGSIAEVEPVLAGLARTLERIHRDRNLSVSVRCDPHLKFRGEKQDLEESAGNLMDNACKWAKTKVNVAAELQREPAGDGRMWLHVIVDDDGPGLPPDKRADALKRGRRLDETKPGSGLGLSIVTETVSMYNGSIELSDAPAGGLRVAMRLPAIA